MTTLDLKLLLLILVANAAPILANHLARGIPKTPLDGGRLFWDGRPLLGESKTWRGLFSAVLLTVICAWLLALPLGMAAIVALWAMCGDLCASFIKRRLKLASSDKALLLDQLPESLFPALYAQWYFGLGGGSVIAIVLLFIIIELAVSPLAFRLKIRKRPY